MYVRQLSWAREVALTITHPELVSLTCGFADLVSVRESLFSPLPNNHMVSLTRKKKLEQLKILYDCITHTRPGQLLHFALLSESSQLDHTADGKYDCRRHSRVLYPYHGKSVQR